MQWIDDCHKNVPNFKSNFLFVFKISNISNSSNIIKYYYYFRGMYLINENTLVFYEANTNIINYSTTMNGYNNNGRKQLVSFNLDPKYNQGKNESNHDIAGRQA